MLSEDAALEATGASARPPAASIIVAVLAFTSASLSQAPQRLFDIACLSSHAKPDHSQVGRSSPAVEMAAGVAKRSAVVIGPGIVVALRRRGRQAQRLRGSADRADLVGD